MECFVDAPGYVGRYKVSPDGDVWSCYSRKLLSIKGCKDKKGYVMLRCSVKGKRTNLYVHRIVCRAFNGDKPGNNFSVNHKNGNKEDNRASNLEWITISDNLKEGYRMGLNGSHKRGPWNAGGSMADFLR
jgi:hypothetical protein